MFIRSMRWRLATTTETQARSMILTWSRSRSARSICLESWRPRGNFAPSNITAATTTGPASGPRPASSTPATQVAPRFT